MRSINKQLIFPENLLLVQNSMSDGKTLTYLNDKGIISNNLTTWYNYISTNSDWVDSDNRFVTTEDLNLLPKTIANIPTTGIKISENRRIVDPRGFDLHINNPYEFIELISEETYTKEMGFLCGMVYVWDGNSNNPILVSENSELYRDLLDRRKVQDLPSLRIQDLKEGMIYIFETGEKRTFIGKGPLHDSNGISENKDVYWFLEQSDNPKEVNVDWFTTGVKFELKLDLRNIILIKSKIKDLRYIGTKKQLVRAKDYKSNAIYYWLDSSDNIYKAIYIYKIYAKNQYIFRKYTKGAQTKYLQPDFSNYEIFELI